MNGTACRWRSRRLGILAMVLSGFGTIHAAHARDNGEPPDAVERGRELFAREWLPRDGRSKEGDGLGPVYNERSCLGCHHLGGPGGASGADKNIEIVTAGSAEAGNDVGAFYAFGMSFGTAGFQYKFTTNPGPAHPVSLNRADLAQIHAGFRSATSVVLHRYGPDPDYRRWRESVPGPHGLILVRSSQRNPTPLFGTGLIDEIPDDAIEAAARRRFAGWPDIRGRVSRLADGRIGRFGWKAQAATLEEFVASAASVEMGLEVPGHHQASDPRFPALTPPGLDLDADDVSALVDYVRSLPPPSRYEPDENHEAQVIRAGGQVFKTAGCATCHVPRLGEVEGIYSDLLLHDMSPQLGDTSAYGIFTAVDPIANPNAGEAPRPVLARKPRNGNGGGPGSSAIASPQEWRTPPLWGLRASAPYLHDGRAENLDQAIRGHGGQATASARRYAQLSAQERGQLEAFLLSLGTPQPAKPRP